MIGWATTLNGGVIIILRLVFSKSVIMGSSSMKLENIKCTSSQNHTRMLWCYLSECKDITDPN